MANKIPIMMQLLPTFPAVRRQLELAEKYKQLKESGRLERYLARRRKRNAQRDRRQLPFKRH